MENGKEKSAFVYFSLSTGDKATKCRRIKSITKPKQHLQ